MDELRPRLWRWTARHPDWKPNEPGESAYWGPTVASLLYRSGDPVVPIDPIVALVLPAHDAPVIENARSVLDAALA